MDMIELYVQEVGRRLPEKNRLDIEKEIRSLIEDALEDKSQEQGRAPDEAMVVEVLKKLDSPEKMAAAYLPPRYLIGPELFPAFLTTLKIVFSVVAVLAVISAGVSLGWSASLPEGIVQGLWKAAQGVVTSLYNLFAIVVIIFAIIQLTSPELRKYLQNREWDPREMKPEPDPERVKRLDLGLEAFFSLLAIVVFNRYSEWIGFSNIVNGEWVHAPVLTEIFFLYLPWLSLLWALQASLDVVLLSQGRWTNLTRWLAVGLGAFSIIINMWMLLGPSIVAIDPATFTMLGWTSPSPEALVKANQALVIFVRIALGITIAVKGLELAKHLYKLLLRGRVPVLEV
jgi:hypothetical protein